MGASSYYTGVVKIRNETESLPNLDLGTSSPLSGLYDFRMLIMDGVTWEAPLTFRVNELSFSEGKSQLSNITINGIEYPVNKSAMWNSNKSGYYYSLFIELWIFNSTSGISQFHNRAVNLILNMTQ